MALVTVTLVAACAGDATASPRAERAEAASGPGEGAPEAPRARAESAVAARQARSDQAPSADEDRPAPAVPPATSATGLEVRELVLEPEGRAPVRVRVEIARSEADKSRGLMHRRALEADAGMLFVYDTMEQRSFWMENTHVPLDMVFLDASGRVVGIVENARPLTRTSREVQAPSQYVLEVNAGHARRHGVVLGTRVRVADALAPVVGPDTDRGVP